MTAQMRSLKSGFTEEVRYNGAGEKRKEGGGSVRGGVRAGLA